MANDNSMAYLATLGLDGSVIAVDSVTREGYEQFILARPHRDDSWTFAVSPEGHRARGWAEWPEGFDFDALVAAWVADGNRVVDDTFFFTSE